MQARDSMLPAALPAWPTLLGIQLVLAAVLVGAWWRVGAGPRIERTPLEAQVLALDPDQARQAVDAALRSEQRAARALMPDQESRTKSFLSLTAAAAGLELVRSSWSAQAEPDLPGVIAADLRVEVRGDGYGLPAFLDGLHRHSATVRVRAVAVSVEPGGRVQALVDLRYHRPTPPQPDLVADRVARTVPAATPASRQLLADAGEAARWRAFASHAALRSAAGEDARARLARELPAGLVATRLAGGTVSWSPAAGLQVDARPQPG